MRHADFWAAAACHSGDMAFELCYLADLTKVLTELRLQHGGSIERFIRHFEAALKPAEKDMTGAQFPRHGRELRSRSHASSSASACPPIRRPRN